MLVEIEGNAEINGIRQRIVYYDSAELLSGLNKNLFTVQRQGFLLALYGETTLINDSTSKKKIYLGQQFQWASLDKGTIPESILSRAGFREKFYNGSVFKLQQISNLYEKVLQISQNSGYPFASIGLDSVKIANNSIKASLNYESGPIITFDSLQITANADIKRRWIESYLGIIPGEIFSQKKVDKIEERIEQLTFVRLKEVPQIKFRNSKAEVVLTLEKIKSNSIDGIVGFLPNEKADGSLLITGQLDLNLNNLFNSGKKLSVQWQSLKPRSQLLNLNYLHRNFLRTPLDVRGNFYLLKEDSIFINRKGGVSLQYQTGPQTISFFTSLESSRRLGTSMQETIEEDKEVFDFNINYYGATYALEKIRNRQKVPIGYTMSSAVAIGNKSIRNLNVLPLAVQEVTQESSTQYKLEANISGSLPIARNLALYTRISGGKLINDQLFLNDLFRIGGLQSLRGFNENFFFASEYVVSTVELRLYYESDAYLFGFFDQSYLYYSLAESNFEDYPLGVGVGINLLTNAGKLNLAFALGKSDQQSLSLSLSKFHFGYIAEF